MAVVDNDAYLTSLASASGDIKREVANGLREVARQRASGAAQASQVPGAARTAFNESQSRLGGNLATLGIEQSPAVAAAFQGGRDSYGTIGTLLGQGFAERATRQEGGVQMLGQQLQSDLSNQTAQYQAQRASQAAAQQFAAEEAARDRAFQDEMFQRQLDQPNLIWREAIAAAMQADQEAAKTDPGRLAKARYLAMTDRRNL
jgi:hypothetical protein